MPSEVVPVETPAESQVLEPSSDESLEAPATPAIDVTTLEKRLRGKDQALTAAQRERDAIKAEFEALSKWKAEKEQADMTELQKAQAEVARLQSIAAAAEAKATAASLARQYPLAAELLGDDLPKFDEVRVAEINGRLAKEASEAEPEAEARIDPNSPRRTAPKAPRNDLEAKKAALAAAGNPYFNDDAWGSTSGR